MVISIEPGSLLVVLKMSVRDLSLWRNRFRMEKKLEENIVKCSLKRHLIEFIVVRTKQFVGSIVIWSPRGELATRARATNRAGLREANAERHQINFYERTCPRCFHVEGVPLPPGSWLGNLSNRKSPRAASPELQMEYMQACYCWACSVV